MWVNGRKVRWNEKLCGEKQSTITLFVCFVGKKISTSGRRKNHFTSLTIHDLPIYTHFFALLVWCRASPWEIIIFVYQINQKKKTNASWFVFNDFCRDLVEEKEKKRSSKNYFIFIFIYLFRAKIIKIDWTKLANALESF